MTFRPRRLLLLAAILPLASATLEGQEPVYPDHFGEPMPVFSAGLGPLSRPITTTSPQAQAYFDQGLQLLYAFTPVDAARSFREAWARDPDCAMCFFGEAWAWGPYLNGPMGEQDAPRAWVAVQRALDLARRGKATAVERAMIEAMAVRYEPTHDGRRRSELDRAYADAMGRVYEGFPQDLDVGALYGESLMLLEPRRGNWDIDDPDVVRIHRVLEETLSRDLTHPGACHLYIHATESTTRADKAEACADHLGSAIPGASHINHMPSHTYNRIGRWEDAVRANIQAWHSDLKAEIGEGFAIYPSHNLHMLLFAASMDGQGAVAIQAGKDYGKLVPGGVFYQVLALVRFGRFDEVLELEDVPEDPIFKGLWDFGRGYAHLRVGDPDNARVYLERVERAARETPEEANFRGHTAAQLLGVVGGILRGELHRSEGRMDDAIAALERAVEIEDGLRYDEPEPLNFSARHWLGAVLLEAGHPTRAEAVYRAALEDHPENGWCLLGLSQALEAQGRHDEAKAAHERFDTSWARSDTWVRGSRF